MNFFYPFDLLALIVLWWTAFAALEGGHEADSWRSVVLTLALIALKIFALLGALALFARPEPVAWWVRGIMYPGAIISAWLYDYRFGIARHARMAARGTVETFQGIRGVFCRMTHHGKSRKAAR